MDDLFGGLPPEKKEEKTKGNDNEKDKERKGMARYQEEILTEETNLEERKKESERGGRESSRFKFIPSSLQRKKLQEPQHFHRTNNSNPANNFTGEETEINRNTEMQKQQETQTQTQTQNQDQNQNRKKEKEKSKFNYYAEEEVDPEDLYDPAFPNDYLQFLREVEEKEKEAIKRKELEEYHRLAQEVHQERHKDEELGEIRWIQESSIGEINTGGIGTASQPPGRGRGRGMNNLPAWMVSQQQQQQKQSEQYP